MSAVVYFTTSDSRPRLSSIRTQGPSLACTLEYLNEGGANLVFRVLPEDGRPLPESVAGRLLRVRKDLPHVQSTAQQLQDFDEHFKPLFPPDNLIQHSLVQLDSSIPGLLNKSLSHLTRPPHRVQDLLSPSEGYGLLVTDMTPTLDSKLLQLKPKWLAQSPNAPENAKRCRTCALRAQRASRDTRTATDKQASCPLALVSENTDDRQRAAEAVTEDVELQVFLVHEALPLLLTLQRWQVGFDSDGVVGASTDTVLSSNLCKAMTLRDCTLFVRRSDTGVVDYRLGDLDLKQTRQRAKWERMEQSLIDGGWYTHDEESSVWAEENICLLSRAR